MYMCVLQMIAEIWKIQLSIEDSDGFCWKNISQLHYIILAELSYSKGQR